MMQQINKKCMKGSFCSFIFLLFLGASGFTQTIEWRTKPQYVLINPFCEGIASVASEKGKWGYINSMGEEIVKPEFDRANDFSDGIGVITGLDSEIKVLVDVSGKLVYPERSLKVDPRFAKFSDGLLLVTDGKKWGYLNKTGKLQIECKYVVAHPFSEGLAAVTTSSYGIGGWAYINPMGDGVISQENYFTWASSFVQGKAIVIFSKQLTYINKNGERIVGKLPKLTSAMDCYDTFTGKIKCKEGTAQFDGQGRFITVETKTGIQTFCDSVEKIETNFVQVKTEGKKQGLIINGKETPCQFDDVLWFNPNTAIIKKGGKLGVVSISENNMFSLKLMESSLLSVFGNPATANILVRNLTDEPMINIKLVFKNYTEQYIELLNSKESKELKVPITKDSDELLEVKKIEVLVCIDSIEQNPIHLNATIKDKPSLSIFCQQTSLEVIPNEIKPVLFQIKNISEVKAENLIIQVFDQSEKIFDQLTNIPAKDSVCCKFNLTAAQSQTKEIEIIAKSPKASAMKLQKAIRINVKNQNVEERVNDGIIKTDIEVLENRNKFKIKTN